MTNLQQSPTPIATEVIRVTGQVLPVGNGAVGKSSLAQVLVKYKPEITDYSEIIRSIRRTNNLEFEYMVAEIRQGSTKFSVIGQLLIPPGQKSSEEGAAGRSFQQVMRIYRFLLKPIDVFLLTYDISDRTSFLDLKYWLNSIKGLYNQTTNFLLVGTHLDQSNQSRQVSDEMVENGRQQVENFFNQNIPEWQGSCFPVEVSNIDGKNIDKMEVLIAKSILWSHGHISGQEFIESYDYLFDPSNPY